MGQVPQNQLSRVVGYRKATKERRGWTIVLLAAFYLLEWQRELGFFFPPVNLSCPWHLPHQTGKDQSHWQEGHKPFCPALIIAQAFMQHPCLIALFPHFHSVFLGPSPWDQRINFYFFSDLGPTKCQLQSEILAPCWKGVIIHMKSRAENGNSLLQHSNAP